MSSTKFTRIVLCQSFVYSIDIGSHLLMLKAYVTKLYIILLFVFHVVIYNFVDIEILS